MTRGRSLYRRGVSLRTRMVLLAAVVVVVLPSAGGLVILGVIRAGLIDDLVDDARAQAEEVADLAEAGRLPDQIPVVGDVEIAVQVVSGGQVLSANQGARGSAAFDLPEQPPGATALHSLAQLPVQESGPYRVVARGMRTPDGEATVYVAVSLEDIDDTTRAVIALAASGLPVLVVVVSILMWVVIGRTLAPVEAIRSEAGAITGRGLDRRVPVPAQRDEIGRLARTVNAMLARLEESSERQQRFVADAAHELRTPVASLRAQLEAELDGGGQGSGAELAEGLLHETIRMQRLVEQLLLLAHADAGSVTSRRVAVDLDDVVEAAVPTPVRGSRVDVDLHDVSPVQVTGDPLLLEQVARNLLDNAVRHADRTVKVTLSSAAGSAVLTVDDDGHGIPPAHRSEVFHRFSRLDTNRDRGTGGVGLGLAIVADLVRAHGGTVDVGDSPSGGARFTVTLPLG